MNKTKYTCALDSQDSLHVVERDMDRISFITEREGSWTGSAWLSPEDTADLARRLAEHVGLVVEPEPFKRDAEVEDIRKGDLVRVEYLSGDLTLTRTGVADHRVLAIDWMTAKREFLPMSGAGYTITILSRPEPEPLPTTPGAVVKLWLGRAQSLVTLGADGYWRGTLPDGEVTEVKVGDPLYLRGTYWDRFEVVA